MGHSERTLVKLKALICQIWFDVGVIPETVPAKLKSGAITMRPRSRFYDRDEWVSKDGMEKMMTAYSVLPDNFTQEMASETKLKIVEYDTHYTLQVLVAMENDPTTREIKRITKLLEKFVNAHFKIYLPETKATGPRANS